MKILVVGSYNYEMYENALYKAFLDIGEDAYIFAWNDFRYKGNSKVLRFLDRFQERFLYGPQINKINKELIEKCKGLKPELIFIYRGTHIRPQTVKSITKLGIRVFSYNNDDPFSKVPSEFYWRHYTKSTKLCNHNFVYREKNLKEFRTLGIHNSSLLRSYYIESHNYPIKEIKIEYDVVFIGHFEDDGRDEALLALINTGVKVNIFGGELWKNSKLYNNLKYNITLGHFDLEEYNRLLNKTKIALVFLSKHNHDTYTRRCFEIPAAQVMMVSEYTNDLNSMFEDEKEVVFFHDKEQLIEKVKYYLVNDKERDSIAKNGYKRVLSDKHEIKDRAREILSIYFCNKDNII